MDNTLRRVYYGNSMKGTFRIADFVTLESFNIKNLRKGDIIAYRSEHKKDDLIVHRIICIDKGKLFTRGDNNRRPDILSVSKSNLIGKVTFYERKGKLHCVIGGIPGLIMARIKYFFRRSAYLFFTKIKWIISAKIISESLNRFWKHRIQKIKVNTKEGPVIKWIFRNRTLFQQLPDNTLQRSSILSYFLTETKNPYFPSVS